MSQLDTDIEALQTDITNLSGVVTSAITLINGIQAQIQAAVAAAIAAGATADQLAALNALDASLQANAKSLADAVAANTPAAPAP